MPKTHTCSGPDSHNEQDTDTQGAITNGTPVPPLQVRTTPHVGGPAEQQKADGWLADARSGSSDNNLRSRWPNSSNDGLRMDAAATRPLPTSPLEGRGQAIKAKEPGARSADGGGDPVGDEDFLAATTSAPTTEAICPPADPHSDPPGRTQRRRIGAKAGQPQNTNAALAACDVLGGPPVRAARQSLLRQEGAPGAEPEPAETASPTR
jgi:hypothetical protein